MTLTCRSTVVRLEVLKDRPPEVKSSFVLPGETALMSIEPYPPDLITMLYDKKELCIHFISQGYGVLPHFPFVGVRLVSCHSDVHFCYFVTLSTRIK